MTNAVLGFLAGSALAMISHWLVLRRDHTTRLKEREIELYLRLLDGVSDIIEFAEAVHKKRAERIESGNLDKDPDGAKRGLELIKQSNRLALQFALMGSGPVIEAFSELIAYCSDTDNFDRSKAHEKAVEIGYAMCCDIHGQKHVGKFFAGK